MLEGGESGGFLRPCRGDVDCAILPRVLSAKRRLHPWLHPLAPMGRGIGECGAKRRRAEWRSLDNGRRVAGGVLRLDLRLREAAAWWRA